MAKAAAGPNPKNITLRGRLSFPRFKHAEAVAFAANSKFDSNKTPEQISSSFTLLIEQDQLDKFKEHLLKVYLPYAEAQHKAGEKLDGALDDKAMKRIKAFLEDGDLDVQPPFMPIKSINEKYQDQTPECVARIDVKGPKGGDITLKARVENEQQMLVPDPDQLSFPVIKPLEQTVFDMYPGAYVAVTLNLFNYLNSASNFGIGAGGNTAVYMGNLEGERLGGGTDVNEDDIFMD